DTLNGNESYAYDAVGNRSSSHRSASYGYQPNNRLTSAGSANYEYDTNGSMTLKSGNGSGSYAWDYENRLSSMMNENLDTATYTYDALGRRVSENISSWLHGNSDIKFMYDGQDVMLDDSLGSLTKYQNAPG